MATSKVTDADVISWVRKSLGNEEFIKYEIKLTGKTEKGDGYASEIVFVEISGIDKDGKSKIVNLVVKHGKNNDYLRTTGNFRSIFESEIHVYETVFPVFKRFQTEKCVSDGFNSMPKCFSTLLLDNMEVLVLENLRTKGYKLHDRTNPLNLNHLKLILREYGKLHAFSFALKDQNIEQFNSISSTEKIFEKFFEDNSVKETFHKSNVDALNILRNRGNNSLCEKLEKVLVRNSIDIILDLMAEEEPQQVILHGDCWNNNFMFKYKGGDETTPAKVKILDWQVSAVRSPVFDISYLIYANSSQAELEKFEELLETYYSSFSSFLRELGSNPEELFTYSDLKRHWKKYSSFGVLFVSTLLKFVLCKKEDAPSFEDLKEGEQLGNLMSFDIGDVDAYYYRLNAIFTHYFKSVKSE